MAKGITGKDAAITYMVTVTPSINPRTTNPPDHIEPDIVDGENTCAHGHSQKHETVAFACYFPFRSSGE
jgi:hypothetical protein